MSIFKTTQPHTADRHGTEQQQHPDLPDLPDGYDDPDGPRWVHPSIRPHFRADPLRDRHRLSDRGRLVAWARKKAILNRYAELSAQEDDEIAAGRYPQTRTGNRGPRHYPAEATVVEQKMAVGTNFTFDETTISEDTVQDFLRACRITDATEARKTAELLAAGQAWHHTNITCQVCGYQAHDRWAIGLTQLRDDLEVRACPPCLAGLEAALLACEAGDVVEGGRTRVEAVHAYLDQRHGDQQ